jgi:hypothetical protein
MTLLKKLTEINGNKPLDERWKGMRFRTDCKILKQVDLKCLESSISKFSEFVLLKDLICKRAKSSFTNLNLNFWLINDWGGIKTFQRTEKNEAKILLFADQLKEGRLSHDTFSTISSLSKIASFVDPKNFVIYDSRVIYSINWLILTTKPSGVKFFPMPTGRNKQIQDFDLKTIIHLTNLKQYKSGETLFYTNEEAYHTFCSLVKTLSKKIFKQLDKPYLLEMLLFQSFEEEISKEFADMTKVKINYR